MGHAITTRYKHIRDVVREEAEADAMAVHDRESLRVMVYERALSTVGRIVLGYKGRKIARERRRQVKLDEVQYATADVVVPWYICMRVCQKKRVKLCFLPTLSHPYGRSTF